MNSRCPWGGRLQAWPTFSVCSLGTSLWRYPPQLVQKVYSRRRHHLLIELASLLCFDSMGIQWLLCDFVPRRLILSPKAPQTTFSLLLFLERGINKECGSQNTYCWEENRMQMDWLQIEEFKSDLLYKFSYSTCCAETTFSYR